MYYYSAVRANLYTWRCPAQKTECLPVSTLCCNATVQVYFRVKHGNMEELARHTRDDLWCDLPGVKAVIEQEDAAS
jgi:hypothetical protein